MTYFATKISGHDNLHSPLTAITKTLTFLRYCGRSVDVVHQLHVPKHVVLAVEGGVTHCAVPLSLSKVDSAFVREKIRT